MEPSTGIDPAVKNMDEGVLTYSPLGISQIALSATLYIARRQQGLSFLQGGIYTYICIKYTRPPLPH